MTALVKQILQTAPSCGATPRTWTVTVGSISQISLFVKLTGSGVKARVFHHMRGKMLGAPVFWDIDLRLQPAVEFRSSHATVPSLLFEPSQHAESNLDPVLREGLEIARHWMGTRSDRKDELGAELTSSFLLIQNHLRQRLLPNALEAASRFPQLPGSSLRWEVYQLVAGDLTGRLGGMAKTCPDLILQALELKRENPGGQRKLLSAIVNDEPLARLLDLAATLRPPLKHPRSQEFIHHEAHAKPNLDNSAGYHQSGFSDRAGNQLSARQGSTKGPRAIQLWLADIRGQLHGNEAAAA